ncbi:Peptidase family M28 [Chitinophaga costaii]|uniref:Peptidase family M28 n=1 Tax=Chitinophaga costaii TaxID=1335309 RepID=A0A1C4F3P4_9BACT|nr:M20/M25/M40 family metallo-hydrolase [Chitinophaga costaii]PUZ22093.1 peptidase M28 [Chitinophaga costaii]SCC50474.1 Peptidase family M28 [Chitinophaga costaii]
MRTQILFTGLLVLQSACALYAQQDIKESEVKRIVSTLASDEMRGRKTFTPDIQRASAFIEREFAKAGLQPLPGTKSYRQEFAIYKLEPSSISLQVNGSPATANNVLLRSAASHIGWTAADSRVAIEQIGPDDVFFDAIRKNMQATRNTLVWIDAKHATAFEQLRGYFNNSARETLDSSKSVVFVLKRPADSIINNWNLLVEQNIEQSPLNNVVGILPGKSKKGEYVVFSGHYDHLGILPANEAKDSIANGADDDASGTTAVIALAKHFHDLHNNERTLVFVAFTAEEIGGYGSHYFSRQLNADSVVAMFNIEMIGKEAKFGVNSAFITGYERSDFGTILQKNLEGSVFKFYPDPYPEQNLFYRSDNATLARLGVPAHTISTDQIDSDKLYHSVSDEVKSLDITNITNTIKAIALSATGIVSGKDTPTRIDKTKVN